MEKDIHQLNNFVSMKKDPVIHIDERFVHLMALATNPENRNEGVIRCILSRKGDVAVRGFEDRSQIYHISSSVPFHFNILEPLKLKGSDDLMKMLSQNGELDFIGFEDPDIVFDEDDSTFHIFFTIPLRDLSKKSHRTKVFVGHAEGKSLDDLVITPPLLGPVEGEHWGAKEVSIAPKNSQGFRINLVESSDWQIDEEGEIKYSVIRSAICRELGKPWEYKDLVLHPKDTKYSWCAGHVSPGPLLPQEFIDVGPTRRVGILNGREANTKDKDGNTQYHTFAVGLMIYDFEEGKIIWVSSEPVISDPEARTITFASDFVYEGGEEGVLYAHVDDSFVRAYLINKEGLKKYLPEFYFYG